MSHDEGFFADIYYANYYKFSADGSERLREWNEDIGNLTYVDEMEVLDSSVIIISG